jgi:chromosome segregation ATPase
MAVGVPENDVFAAADAVLARGERPTVERVRLQLGRGSPARVGGLLDQWWEQLAGRLRGESRLPGLPAEVAQAFVAVWQQASTLAQGSVEQALAGQREVLASERETLVAQEARARIESERARQQTVEALTARQNAETRLADLEQLLTERHAQIEDLQQQRNGLRQSQVELQEQVHTVQQSLQTLQQQADQERAAQALYVRGVEDRAYREVDRAREEGKARQVELRELQRQLTDVRQALEVSRTALAECQLEAAARHARGELAAQQGGRERELWQVRAEAAEQMLTEAQRSAIAQQARADTLETQLGQLRDTLQNKRQRNRT